MTAWITTFLIVAALDLMWAAYTVGMSNCRHPAIPAAWAVPLYALSGMATINWTQDHWLLVPACAGAFAGTYLGAWWNRRKTES